MTGTYVNIPSITREVCIRHYRQSKTISIWILFLFLSKRQKLNALSEIKWMIVVTFHVFSFSGFIETFRCHEHLNTYVISDKFTTKYCPLINITFEIMKFWSRLEPNWGLVCPYFLQVFFLFPFSPSLHNCWALVETTVEIS